MGGLVQHDGKIRGPCRTDGDACHKPEGIQSRVTRQRLADESGALLQAAPQLRLRGHGGKESHKLVRAVKAQDTAAAQSGRQGGGSVAEPVLRRRAVLRLSEQPVHVNQRHAPFTGCLVGEQGFRHLPDRVRGVQPARRVPAGVLTEGLLPLAG